MHDRELERRDDNQVRNQGYTGRVPMPGELGWPEGLVYLASPYTHAETHVRYYRHEQAQEANALLCKIGVLCYSPIAHCHPIAETHGLPTDWQFWARFDTALIKACEQLWVLCIKGWDESKGVLAEIEIAKTAGLPIRYFDIQQIRQAFREYNQCLKK